MRTQKNQCFTLIEIMVVLAIIVILFMLLLPAITNVKENAKRIKCLSRIKDIASTNSFYASRNDGQVAFAGDYYHQGTFYNNQDYAPRMVLSVKPEAYGKYNPIWWMFICSNVLPYWNASATQNAEGYTPGKPNNLMDKIWAVIDPAVQDHTNGTVCHTYGNGADATQGAAYSFGNFGTNQAVSSKLGDFVKVAVGASSNGTQYANQFHMSWVRSPGKRAYIIEAGEATNQDNAVNVTNYVPYNDQFSRGQNHKGSATGYIPGQGGGGIGAEKYEKIGCDSTITDELDSVRYERVTTDIREGRHNGYTLHGFFDGHAEAISADTIGMLSLGPGDDLSDLKGPYGRLTRPYDED